MGFFPFFIDIKNKKCIIVGGGKVALRKIEKLVPLEPKITVVAPVILHEIKCMKGIEIAQRNFIETDLDEAFMVIAATDEESVNAYIYEICCQRGILVNTVDDPEKCGFIFPALVNKGSITVGISTSGKSPIMAGYIRKQIEKIIDKRLLEILGIMEKKRPIIKAEYSKGSERKSAAEKLLEQCLQASAEELHKLSLDSEFERAVEYLGLEDTEYEN